MLTADLIQHANSGRAIATSVIIATAIAAKLREKPFSPPGRGAAAFVTDPRRAAQVGTALVATEAAVLVLQWTRYGALVAASFFASATAFLVVARKRRPAASCGCLGDLSKSPIGLRSIVRPLVLSAAAALCAVGGTAPTHLSLVSLAAAAVVLATTVAASPEVSQSISRRKRHESEHADRCGNRPVPFEVTLDDLRRTAEWRDARLSLQSDAPEDTWRVGCWRFFAFRAIPSPHEGTFVFGIHLDRTAQARVAYLSEERVATLQHSAS